MPSPTVRSPVVVLAVASAVEYAVRGRVFWAPALLCALLLAIYQLVHAYDRRHHMRRHDALARLWSRERLREKSRGRDETANWANAFSVELWPHFVVPLLQRKLTSTVIAQVDKALPSWLRLRIASFNVGDSPPLLTSMTAYRKRDGQLHRLDAGFEFQSPESFDVHVELTTPWFRVSARVDNVSAKGTFVVTPKMEERLVFFAFAEPPQLDYNVHIDGPIGSSYLASLVNAKLVKTLISAAIYQEFCEPRRQVEGLEYAPTGQRTIGGGVVCSVVDFNHFDALTGTYGLKHVDVEISSSNSKANDCKRRIPLSSDALHRVQQFNINFKLGKKTSGTKLSLYIRAPDGRRSVLACARINVKHLKDGSTLFWGIGRRGDVLCKRWTSAEGPWEVVWPLELPMIDASRMKMDTLDKKAIITAEDGRRASLPGSFMRPNFGLPLGASVAPTVTLRLSTLQWQYGANTSTRVYRTPGARTILLRITEANGLKSADANGKSDPYVQLKYGNGVWRTDTAYETLDPVWCNVFAIPEEHRLIVMRSMIFKLFDEDKLKIDASLGFCKFNTDVLHENEVLDTWLDVTDHARKRLQGRLRIAIAVVPGPPGSREVQEAQQRMFAPPSSSSDANNVPEALELVLHAGRNLKACDRNGSSDPYCVISHGEQSSTSSVKLKTLSPQWAHRFVFRYNAEQAINIECWDQDKAGMVVVNKDFMGSIAISRTKLEQQNWCLNEWIKLSRIECGELHIQIKAVALGLACGDSLARPGSRTLAPTTSSMSTMSQQQQPAFPQQQSRSASVCENDFSRGNSATSHTLNHTVSNVSNASFKSAGGDQQTAMDVTTDTPFMVQSRERSATSTPVQSPLQVTKRASSQSTAGQPSTSASINDMPSSSSLQVAQRASSQNAATQRSTSVPSTSAAIVADDCTPLPPSFDSNGLADEGMDAPVPTQLLLKVVEGRNLVAKDRNGFSDPFCKIRYGNQRKDSSIVYKTLNPQWSPPWQTTLNCCGIDTDILIKCRDYDRLKRADPLGHCTLSARRLIANGWRFADWLELQSVPHGELYIEVEPLWKAAPGRPTPPVQATDADESAQSG